MDSFSDFFEENDAETIRKIQQEYFERPDEEIDDTFLADDIDENNSPVSIFIILHVSFLIFSYHNINFQKCLVCITVGISSGRC